MPQLDTTYYSSQVFWMIITLSSIIVFNYVYFFPEIEKEKTSQERSKNKKEIEILTLKGSISNLKLSISNLYDSISLEKEKINLKNDEKKWALINEKIQTESDIVKKIITEEEIKNNVLDKVLEIYKSSESVKPEDILTLAIDDEHKRELENLYINIEKLIIQAKSLKNSYLMVDLNKEEAI